MKGKVSEMERKYLRITFEGEGVLDHEADVETFAPALMATAQLLQRVTRIKHGSGFNVKLKLAGIEGNCISFDLAIVQSLFERVLDVLDKATLSDTLTIIGLLQVNTNFTLIGFIRWLRGRKVARKTPQGDMVIVETEDGDSVSIPKDVSDIAEDEKVRKALRGATKPLEAEGIDKMIFVERQTGSSFELLKEDSPFFEVQATVDDPIESEADVYGKIDRPSLQGEKSGWKLIQGDAHISMTVEDEEFLEAVKNNEIYFSSDTLFRVTLATTQTVTADGRVQTKNTARKMRIVKLPPQVDLPFEGAEI